FSLGIAACLLIALFVRDELSYDKHYQKGDQIFRVYNESNENGNKDWWVFFHAPIADVLRTDFPEIGKVGRLIPQDGWFDSGSNLFRRTEQTQNLFEEGFAYADPEMLEILEVPMVYGSRHLALAEPNTIALS